MKLFDAGALGGAVDRWRSDIGGIARDDRRDPSSEGDAPAAEAARVQGRVERALSRVTDTSRVADGLVAPYFHTLAAALRDGFKLQVDEVDSRPDGAGARTEDFEPSWAPEVAPGNGNPFASASVPDVYGDARPASRDDGARGALEFCLRWNDGQFAKTTGWAVMLLVQTADGRPLATKLIGSSGHAGIERVARQALLSAAEARPAPEHGLGLGTDRIKSIWRFEAKVLKRSPACPISGRFDEALGVAPTLDKVGEQVVLTQVVLVAVRGGESTPRAAGSE